MAKFNYIAKSREGQDVRSSLDAPTRLGALEILRKKGLTVVDLYAADEGNVGGLGLGALTGELPEARKADKKPLIAPRIRITELAIFCRQLAISVKAGLPLRDALDGIATEMENASLKQVCVGMVQELHDGNNFSGAVAKYPRVFNKMFLGLVLVAEESGKMPETLAQLATYMERTDKLQRRIRAMSSYPAFIGIFFVVVSLVMTLKILPMFTDIFAGQGGNLPTLTTMVFAFNNFFVDHILYFVLGTLFVVVTTILYFRTDAGAVQRDRMKLSAPIFGGSVKKYVLARFCRSLSIMVNSGVPISTALEICAEAAGNHVVQRSVMEARDRIVSGGRIAASLQKTGMFPGLVVRMVTVGEESGQLPEVLESVADLYDDQVETSIMASMALFEPVVICIFGAFVLLLVLAIYLPVFTSSTGMGAY